MKMFLTLNHDCLTNTTVFFICQIVAGETGLEPKIISPNTINDEALKWGQDREQSISRRFQLWHFSQKLDQKGFWK